MAKKPNEKDSSFESQREQEAKEAKKEAQKKLRAAEKAKAPAGKGQKADKAEKAAKKKRTRRWLKDFRGELKKIVWPDFKTVMKNTGIVLVTVAVIGAMVWILDFVLSSGVKGLKTLAQGVQVTQTEPDFGNEDFLFDDIELPTAPYLEDTTEQADVTEAQADTTEDEHAGHDHD